MKLSIVIPAYNEARRIKETLETVVEFCERELSEWQIIVVDDGSQDNTSLSAFEAAAGTRGRVKCLRNDSNRGKGYSVRRGMLAADLDPVLFSDADLSTPIVEALALHEAIQKGADVAIASRKPDPRKEVERTPRRKLMANVFRILVKLIVLRGIYDTQCGFKMFRRSAVHMLFPRQRLDRWGFDVELLYMARKLGLSIAEVPASWRESSESRLQLTTPLDMILDLLLVRWNDLLGRYRSPGDIERATGSERK